MEIPKTTVTLVFVFLPGVLCLWLVGALTPHKRWTHVGQAVGAFVLGLACYGLWYAVLAVRQSEPTLSMYATLAGEGTKLDLAEVLWASMLAVPLGFGVAYAVRYKVLYRLAWRIRASNEHGDIDLWNFVMSLDDSARWVTVRDRQNDRMYRGWVRAASGATEPNELLLREVDVYENRSGEFLYRTPGLYLACPRSALAIEFPAWDAGLSDQEGQKGETSDAAGSQHG